MGNTVLNSADDFPLISSNKSSESMEEVLNYSKSKINPDIKIIWDTELLRLSRHTSVFIKKKKEVQI